jgi:hypothetical protein
MHAARTGQVGDGGPPCPDGACGEGGPPPESRCVERCARSASPVRGRSCGARCCNSGGVVPELNVGLRLGQSGRHRCRVAFTCPMDAAHPERRSDALHKSHAKQQHRMHPTMQRRRGNHSVCCFECLCHGRDYTRAFCPTGFDHNHPPNSGGKWLSGNESSIQFPTNWNITIQHMWAHSRVGARRSGQRPSRRQASIMKAQARSMPTTPGSRVVLSVARTA